MHIKGIVGILMDIQELIRWSLVIVVIIALYYFLFFKGRKSKKTEKFDWAYFIKDSVGYAVVTFVLYILLILIAGFTGSADFAWILVAIAITSIIIYRSRNRIRKFMKKK